MHRLSVMGAFLLCLISTTARAQGRVELTPTLGFVRGGHLILEERAIYHRDFELNVDSGGTYGLRCDIPLSSRVQLELLLDRYDGELEDEKGLFGEQPGGFIPPGQRDLLDVGIMTFQAGILWELNRGPARGYLTASAGAARIDLKLPLEDDTRLAASVGAGVKLDLSPELGLRLEGRGYWVDTDSKLAATQSFEHRDCVDPCTYTYRYDSKLVQGGVSVGLVIKL